MVRTFRPHTVPDPRERPRGPLVFLYFGPIPFAVGVLPLSHQVPIVEVWEAGCAAPHWVGYDSGSLAQRWETAAAGRASDPDPADIQLFSVGLRLCPCGNLFHGDKGPCPRSRLVTIDVPASFSLLPAVPGWERDPLCVMGVMVRLLRREELR